MLQCVRYVLSSTIKTFAHTIYIYTYCKHYLMSSLNGIENTAQSSINGQAGVLQ